MQLPTNYKVNNKVLYDVPYEEVISETNDFALRVEVIDYSHIDKNTIRNFLLSLGIKSFP